MRRLLAMLPMLLAPGFAQAGDAMVVRLRGLDLSTTAGALLAIQRMDDAAVRFCASPSEAGPRTMDVTTLKCRRDMAHRAGRKLNHWNVTARQSGSGVTLLAYASVVRPPAPSAPRPPVQ